MFELSCVYFVEQVLIRSRSIIPEKSLQLMLQSWEAALIENRKHVYIEATVFTQTKK